MELKKVQDYYDELFKLYPDVPKKDIKKIHHVKMTLNIKNSSLK